MAFTPKLSLKAQVEAKKKELEQAALAKNPNSSSSSALEFAPPESVPEKIRIIFDNSTSMQNIAQEVRDGCIEFLKHCTFNQTACAVHLMNPSQGNLDLDLDLDLGINGEELLSTLTTNLPALSVLIGKIGINGGTPMFATIARAQKESPAATRYVLFSDGAPNYHDPEQYKDTVLETAISSKTPIDTVMISYTHPVNKESEHYILLKEVADRTGGIFLVYEKGKSNFGNLFKYLTSGKRLLLADPNFKSKLERGEI